MWRTVVKMREKFARQEQKVTQFLDLILKLVALLGLFSLPSKNPQKSHPITVYMKFVFVFYAIFLICNIFCLVRCSSKNLVEFLLIIMETCGMTFVFIEVVVLNLRRKNVLELLDRMNKFDITSSKTIFANCRKAERVIFFIFGSLIFFSVSVKFVNPFFSISETEAEYVQLIYGLKHPQNRLPLCLSLPYVDTSEPRYFWFLYALELYWALLVFSLGLVEALFFPFILLHLAGQHLVLFKQLRALGKQHVYLRKPHYIPQTRCWRIYQDGLKRRRDLLEMRKCIVFHQKTVKFRALFDSVTERNIRLRVILLTMVTSLSVYPITILSQFDSQKQLLLIAEAMLTLGYYYYNCLLSESLEWSNCLVRQSIYQNKWYEMCPESQRMMLMFLQMTQKPHHIKTFGGIVALGNVHYLKMLKATYSFIRFINLIKR